jgi:hypothetical protein
MIILLECGCVGVGVGRLNRATIYRYGKLKTPTDWAEEKFFCMDRQKLQESMLKWTDVPIHSALIDFETLFSEKEAEGYEKQAQDMFGFIQAFFNCTAAPADALTQMSAMLGVAGPGGKGGATAEQRYAVANTVVRTAFTTPQLRDECYLQVMKQLTSNPHPESVAHGWELMAILLTCVPPNVDFENYLEVFLRQRAEPKAKYVGALHKLVYEGAPKSFPDVSVLSSAAANLPYRARGFSEPLPPAAPSYQDLQTPFVEAEDLEFTKKAPKAVAAATAQVVMSRGRTASMDAREQQAVGTACWCETCLFSTSSSRHLLVVSVYVCECAHVQRSLGGYPR